MKKPPGGDFLEAAGAVIGVESPLGDERVLHLSCGEEGEEF